MTTSVVVNGYEIQNWHTVSILELYRARKTQERGREPIQPAPVEKSEKKTRRSKDMPRSKLTTDQIDEAIALYEGGKPITQIAQQFGVADSSLHYHLKEHGVKKRGRRKAASTKAAAISQDIPQAELVTKVADAAPPAPEPAEQMDDPETVVAAAPVEPPPVGVTELARERARELHAQARMVIATQPLTPSVFARKHPTYAAPRILESGSLFEDNPHAAAKTIEEMVARLNTIPGFQAFFEWRTSGSVGQPLR